MDKGDETNLLPPRRSASALRALGADLRGFHRRLSGSRWRRILACCRTPGVHAVLVYRFGQWLLELPGPVRLPLDPLYHALNLLVQVLWGIDIPRQARIGPGLYIGHFGGIILSPRAVIGERCALSQCITIGTGGRGASFGAPQIGDDVYIAPGARVFGNIRIGSNVKIGANAVVYRDIPEDAIVALDPGFRILSYAGNRRAAERPLDHAV